MSDIASPPVQPEPHGAAFPAGTVGRGLFWLAVVFSLFQIATAAHLVDMPSQITRAVHVGFLMALTFPLMAYARPRSGLLTSLGWALALAGVAVALYQWVEYRDLILRAGRPTDLDITVGVIALLTVFAAGYAMMGIALPIIAGLFLAYCLFGEYLPYPLNHRGYAFGQVIDHMAYGTEGIYGIPIYVSSTYIFLFILFGSFLERAGMIQLFTDVSMGFFGHRQGGAAKVSVVSSGLMGTISGSGVANVVTTGQFTIPLMKRLKYPPAYAGAVEAIASTGGQLAPPIMGTAAFVMAELVGLNYWAIALAGVVPALLFYLGIYSTVHVIAVRQGFSPVTDDTLPDWRGAMSFARLAPIVAGLLGLAFGVINGNSVELTACYGMIAMLVAVLVARISKGEDPRAVFGIILRALEAGGKGVVIVGILLVGAQVFVAMINLTGFGVAVTAAVLSIGQGQLWLIAGLMAVVCLIAGMGLPTSAAYVMVAAVFAPALIQQGLDPLVVHMFVLYYAALSVITPPVCLGVFVAATIAQAPWMKVALQTLRLGATAYALPMLFIAYPGMLGGGGAMAIARAVISGAVFVLAMAHLLGGARLPGGMAARLLWLLPVGLALMPPWWATLSGAAVFGGLVLASRRVTLQPTPPTSQPA
ncbi:MAG TPA: C4-dicarboxylate ABC transporter permease [Citreicella sp.]|nr:C4-dicarboxylate ABC transporter permease [Citreicella sp.]